MLLPVTLTIAAACALINLWLALRLVRGRLGDKVLHGDGGSPAIARGMRAHANFVEYAPIVLILTALIELARGASPWLWAAGALFVAARIAHPLGMMRDGSNPLRAAGALATWLVTLGLAGWAIAVALSADPAPRVIDAPAEVVPRA